MALQQCRLGSLTNILQWDDVDYDSAIETDQPIKAGAPIDDNDVVILGSLGLGSITPIVVTDIDDPSTELNALEGVLGSMILAYEVEATSDQYTLYAYDESDTDGENVPYSVDADTTGIWIAIGGKYTDAERIEGPGSSTDHAVVRWDGVTGRLTQDSVVIIDDTGNLTLPDGAVFSSHNSDHTHLFSRASVGWIGKGNEAGFQHTSLALDGVKYALYQTNLGTTYLNCVTAKEINFCRNDATLVTLTQLTSLVDNSMVDTLHRHSELSASDGTPDGTLQISSTGITRIGDGGTTHYTSISTSGLITFLGSSGLVHGCCHGDHINWTQANMAQTTWYNISDADMISGRIRGVTHNGSGLLTVIVEGRYLVLFNVAWEIDTANKHVEFGVGINGANPSSVGPHVHTESKFANQESDNASSSIIYLDAGDTIQVFARTIDAGTPDIKVDSVHLNCTLIGGP